MNTAQIKLELFRKIDGLEQRKLTQLYLYLVKERKSADFWNELGAFEKEDIELGIEDLNKGRKKNFASVIAKY